MSAPHRDTALFTSAQSRAIDRRAIDELGIPGFELMSRAAAAAFAQLRRHWPEARRVRVVCGAGNNGGDGYLVARDALAAGLHADVVALGVPKEGGDAARARQAFVDAGGVVTLSEDDDALASPDVIVDAIYGTGLNRAPEREAKRAIEAINAAGLPVLALDIPSGLSADTGGCPGVAVRASATATFIVHKRGLHTHLAEIAGGIVLHTLGLPEGILEPPDATILTPRGLPPRPRDSHKGTNGHVLAVGGDHGTGGAVRMAAEAAARTGAGLVSVATREQNVLAMNAARPELMAHAVDGPQTLQPMLDKASVVALGPGLGQAAWGHALWTTALDAGKPTVLDADGLNLLHAEKRILPARIVLTPHPGEAGRLLGVSTAEVQADRFAAVRLLARRFEAVVVLKGNGSLIASPEGEVAVCPWGNPGMASGGMGDTLTGIIAGLLAQGCVPFEAACLGVGLHARAADVAARGGERGLLAGDLLEPLRRLVNGLEA
ncbi:NAD(P)H-hydrate dehydratase [Luteibacter aegosomatissinici]|uniref:NAD(P)H-hydrate dehydratase n=1 Tax=Luteibacter aegosomatissinici TaxID=2911539 RepID=UPI001FF979E4|nr:NAD(P)H-hydrate dehydratase [Luteibacter aegosomatissinici]UPG95518.1 NAD(P)H-hydrate dehydratase [Luteibacter aegosomatissinici]